MVDNEYVRSLRDVPRMFAGGAWRGAGEENPIYRPLTTATYAAQYAVHGLSPAGFHAVNVLLHAAVSALVALLALAAGLSPWAAALAGGLFAAHPVHVEAVANVAGRKDELAALFVLAAVLAHAQAVRRGRWWLAAAPALFAAAMFSKEIGVAGIAAIAAFDALFGEAGHRRRRVALYAAHGAALLAYLAARWAAVGGPGAHPIPFDDNPLASAGAGARLLTAIGVIGRGALLQFAPVTLSPDYSFDAIPLIHRAADPIFLASLAAIALACVAAWRFRPLGLFALVLYAAALFPAANLLFPVGTIFGERLLYLSSAALCLVVAARLPRPVAGFAVLALAARTLAYEPAWKDEPTLFAQAVESQPRSSRAHRLYGGALMERGDPAAAAAQFEQALQIVAGHPRSEARARIELGVAYEALGRGVEAEQQYQSVLRDDPENADAVWRLGDVRWSQARRDEAVSLWSRAVQLDPRHARALSDLGIAAWNAGDLRGAESYWLRAARADPLLARAWTRLGELYQREGDERRAQQAFAEFLRRAHGKFPDEERAITARLRAGGATGTSR